MLNDAKVASLGFFKDIVCTSGLKEYCPYKFAVILKRRFGVKKRENPKLSLRPSQGFGEQGENGHLF